MSDMYTVIADVEWFDEDDFKTKKKLNIFFMQAASHKRHR